MYGWHSEDWVRADNQQFTMFGMRLTWSKINKSEIRRLLIRYENIFLVNYSYMINRVTNYRESLIKTMS
jgi:hypothetical protein